LLGFPNSEVVLAKQPGLSGAAASAAPDRSDAVAIYERALRNLQQHQFAEAADLLRRVIAGFPRERELLERSRLYLALCDRHVQPPTAEPADTAERLYGATLALNAGATDQAIAYLEPVANDEPSNDQALYLLGVAHAARGNAELAIGYLGQAIEANPENRSLARADPDLEPLRREPGFGSLVGSAGPQGSGKPAARR
jgi:tetratricopeptide (TPR) repeat protein